MNDGSKFKPTRNHVVHGETLMAKAGIEFPEKMSADPDHLMYIFKLNVRFFFNG